MLIGWFDAVVVVIVIPQENLERWKAVAAVAVVAVERWSRWLERGGLVLHCIVPSSETDPL